MCARTIFILACANSSLSFSLDVAFDSYIDFTVSFINRAALAAQASSKMSKFKHSSTLKPLFLIRASSCSLLMY